MFFCRKLRWSAVLLCVLGLSGACVGDNGAYPALADVPPPPDVTAYDYEERQEIMQELLVEKERIRLLDQKTRRSIAPSAP
ncbi:MAG: hypothetical protein V6Z81_07225 [Parvularculales bacterium]